MKIDEIRTRLEGIAGFFAARADMAAPGDGKMLMRDWMKAAKEAAALLGVESVPVARIREMMTGEDPEESKAAWRVLKALERREKDAGRGDQDRGGR